MYSLSTLLFLSVLILLLAINLKPVKKKEEHTL